MSHAGPRSEVLGQTGRLVVRRIARADGVSVLVAAAAAETQDPDLLRLLEANLEVSRRLSGGRFLRATGVGDHGGRMAIAFEDPGGRLLSSLLGRPLPLAAALAVAVDLAEALDELHGAGLVYGDLQPAHALVDLEAPWARILALGRPSAAPFGAREASPGEELRDVTAYMAPEQSSWTIRTADARSDLYALGVILYEMLTGRPPFLATGSVEWMHAHVARAARPARERAPQTPGPVSDIAGRLLEKDPGARYQTAAGLAADLRRCLAEWRADGTVSAFALGVGDVSHELVFPETIYGREAEVAALVEGFDRATTSGSPQLVLIGGRSGVGKSSLVGELRKALAPTGVVFVSGKGDQYKRDVPYAALAAAFGEMVAPILMGPDGELEAWKRRVLEATGPNARLIAELAPQTAVLLGEQPQPPAAPPREAHQRAQSALAGFVGCFPEIARPLVIFLDDLQWLDAATLDLLDGLLSLEDTGPLLLIGAYRSNEPSAAHSLSGAIDRLRARRDRCSSLHLEPLARGPIAQLVAHALGQEVEAVEALAELVHARSDGNPFFAVQFLISLSEQELITFDGSRWRWDVEAIVARGSPDSVVDLMLERIATLGDGSAAVLARLACFGPTATPARLAQLLETDVADITRTMLDAARVGLVRSTGADRYAFTHDRIQEAAYAILPMDARRRAHLQIGRMILTEGPLGEEPDMAFEAANQLNRAVDLIEDAQERRRLAHLNLAAGRRARAASAFDVALGHFAAADELLGVGGWRTDPRGAFEATFHRAECEIFHREIEAPERRLAALAARLDTVEEDALVACLRVALVSSYGRHDAALDLGLAFLARYGVAWSRQPPAGEVTAEQDRVWEQVDGRPIPSLIDLPLMSDPEQIAITSVLAAMMVPAMFAAPALFVLVVTRCVNLSLEFGYCDASAMALAMGAVIMVSMTGRQESGREIAQLAVDLVELRGLQQFRARVFLMAGHVLVWTGSLDLLREMGERTVRAGLETGDTLFACYGSGQIVTAALGKGATLAEIERLALDALALIANERDVMLPQVLAQLNVARALRGGTLEFGVYGGDAGVAAAFDRDEDRHHIIIQWTAVRRLERSVFLGDAATAVEAADRVEAVIRSDIAYFEWAECQFYGAIARAQLVELGLAGDIPAQVEALRRHVGRLERWAVLEPATFAHRHRLASAELLNVEGRSWEAQVAYRGAIDLARHNGFPHHEALAHERTAAFFARSGFVEAARSHRQAARLGYLRWGATAKVKALDAVLFEPAGSEAGRSAEPAPTSVEQLDLMTALKVSTALSGEVSGDALIRRLLLLAVEHGGAERGLYISAGEAGWSVAAEAVVRAEGVDVRRAEEFEAAPEAPAAIINYVARSHQTLVLVGRQALQPFASDPYVRKAGLQSVLALPLVKQGRLGGILHLENRLTEAAFSPTRISVLTLIAAQAAAALENAALYDELNVALATVNRSEEALRTTIDAIPAMTWISAADGYIEFMSEVWTEYSGLSSAQTAGEGWLATVHPDDQAAIVAFRDGLLATGEPGEFEVRLRRRDGAYRWCLCNAKPHRDAEGRIVRWYGTALDIHDQRETRISLQRLEGRIAHVSRVAALGELTASIAHEVNQPLAAIVTNADTGLRWLAAPSPNLEEARAVLTRIQGNARRMDNVILKVRHLFARSGGETESLDLNAAVEEMLALTRAEAAQHGIRLAVELASPAPKVKGDRVQLQQVILNLVANAIQAMSSAGEANTLTVRTMHAGGEVRVEVADTGPGIGDGDPERLFDSFQTSKAEGMGLGLSISRTIIDQHGGRIWGEPRVAGGAVFRFELPAA